MKLQDTDQRWFNKHNSIDFTLNRLNELIGYANYNILRDIIYESVYVHDNNRDTRFSIIDQLHSIGLDETTRHRSAVV